MLAEGSLIVIKHDWPHRFQPGSIWASLSLSGSLFSFLHRSSSPPSVFWLQFRYRCLSLVQTLGQVGDKKFACNQRCSFGGSTYGISRESGWERRAYSFRWSCASHGSYSCCDLPTSRSTLNFVWDTHLSEFRHLFGSSRLLEASP